MAASNAFLLFALQKGATVIPGITQQSLPVSSQLAREITSGEIYPRFISLVGQTPTAAFTTRSLATALAQFPIIGTDLAAADVIMWAQKVAVGGTRSATTDHEKFTLQHGVLVPSRLSVQGQGDAELSYLATITFDGTNNSIVRATAALPTGVTDADRYGLGPLTIAGTGFTGVQSFEIDFGIRVSTEVADGDITATVAYIVEFQSILRWTGIDAEWFNDVGLSGTDATTSPVTQVLRHRTDGGTYSGTDLTVTADGMVVVNNAFDATNQDTGTVSLEMQAKFDGTNAPVAIA